MELDRLRNQYLRQGQGRRTDIDGDESKAEEGFKAQVAEQLGIHPATAYRYISVVKALSYCEQIENAPKGEVIELPGAGSYQITPAVREKARQLRVSIVSGDVPMNRAMPAVSGMFGVAGGGTGGKAATNHGANIWTGLQKLINSLTPRFWRKGNFTTGHDWDDAVVRWRHMLDQLPDELKRETADWVKQQGGRK